MAHDDGAFTWCETSENIINPRTTKQYSMEKAIYVIYLWSKNQL